MDEKKELTYEEALAQLNAIVSAMEKSDATLDELLGLYEKGSRLAVFCTKKLDAAKKKASEIAASAGAETED